MSIVELRAEWIDWILKVGFARGLSALPGTLLEHIARHPNGLENHLLTCGVIPERIGHDSSEEKLYSKYTDELLAVALRCIGVTARVLDTRADSADVRAEIGGMHFVADAKAFRLSRTAKNQKDFKIQAMANWKDGAPHALLVAPLYQFPVATSQIYRQAAESDVAIIGYAHMVALIRIDAVERGSGSAALGRILKSPTSLDGSKSADAYWSSVNGAMLGKDPKSDSLWQEVLETKQRAMIAMQDVEIGNLILEAERIKGMSHQEAVAELLRIRRIDQRMDIIRSVSQGGNFR